MNHIEITKTDIRCKKPIQGTNSFLRTKIEDVWPYLRASCTIDSGVTWEDLLRIISKNDSLKCFVEACYPHHLFILPPILISRNITLKHDNLNISPASSTSKDLTDKPLILKNEIKIKNKDKTPLPASMRWTLLEIIDILFADAKSDFSCGYLTRNGFIDEKYHMVPSDDVIKCLMSKCKIIGGTTLGDIFRFVNSNEILKDFMSKYSSCDISAFHKAAKIRPKKLSTDIEYLQVSSQGELDNKKFYILSKFFGVGEVSSTEIPNTEQHSVTMTPMNELVHIPIIVNHQFSIKFAKNSKVFIDCFKDFTLLDILHAIYWDIGFFGNPEKTQVA